MDSDLTFQDELKRMPLCAERQLLQLKYGLTNGCYTNEKIKAEIDLIEKRLKREDIYSHDYQVALDLIKSKGTGANTKQAAVENLNTLMKSIRDIDIQLLIQLTSSNGEAIKKIGDKKIVLFMGPTGSGIKTKNERININFVSR